MPQLDPKWPDNPSGRFHGLITDEAQFGLRNDSNFWWTVKWSNSPRLFLFSGSTAPRGLLDFTSYLDLLEHEEHARDAAKGRAGFDKKKSTHTPSPPTTQYPSIATLVIVLSIGLFTTPISTILSKVS